MNNEVISNILSLIGCILLGISTFSQNKKNMLQLQIGDCAFNALACLVIGSYTGFTTNIIAGIRNIITIKWKMSKQLMAVLISAIIIIGIVPMILDTDQHEISWYIFRIMPLIASTEYFIWISVVETAQSIRYALVINLVLWGIHDVAMRLYPAIVIDLLLIIVTVINIVRGNKNKKE